MYRQQRYMYIETHTNMYILVPGYLIKTCPKPFRARSLSALSSFRASSRLPSLRDSTVTSALVGGRADHPNIKALWGSCVHLSLSLSIYICMLIYVYIYTHIHVCVETLYGLLASGPSWRDSWHSGFRVLTLGRIGFFLHQDCGLQSFEKTCSPERMRRGC